MCIRDRSEVEVLKVGERSFMNQNNHDWNRKDQKRYQILRRDKINNILGWVPQKMLHYYKAQQEGASLSSMTMFDKSVTRVHPVTKKMDGKLRVCGFVGDDVWSIFPQHVKARLTKEALSDFVFFQNEDLCLYDKA